MPEVRLDNINKSFRGQQILKNISFDVKQGEYFTVCGQTGAGKSTLLKIIAGLVEPDSGEIYLDDKCINKVPPEDRGIGMVFEHKTYALFPHLTILENVGYGLRVKGENLDEVREIARQMLELVLLEKRANAYPSECSGGMKQRVALARALVISNLKTGLILLDEPLSALDAKIRMDLRHQLTRLVRELKVTCIHVTQDTEEALMISDRIAIINKGEIIQIGTPLELYERPINLFVCRFLSLSNFFEGKIKKHGEKLTEIELKNGKVIKIRRSSYPKGSIVVVAVRAENIMVHHKRDPSIMNLLEGTVRTSKFVSGNNIEEIEIAENQIIFSKRHATQIWSEPGDKVCISFKPERTLIFPYPEEGLEKALML
ncbi:MAG: ABC transporter ATP-binding protein [Candidatus Helarchaeota archaeon]